METLQGEGLQDCASVYWLGCMGATRVHQEHKELVESLISQERSFPKPSHCERGHEAVNEKMLFAELRYPCSISSSQDPFTVSTYCRLALSHSLHSTVCPALRAHEPQLGQLLTLPSLLFNTNKMFNPKIKAHYIIWHSKETELLCMHYILCAEFNRVTTIMLSNEIGCTLLRSRSVKNSLQRMFLCECKVTYLKKMALEY